MEGFRSAGLTHLGQMPMAPVGSKLLWRNLVSTNSESAGTGEQDDSSSDLDDLPPDKNEEVERPNDAVLLSPQPSAVLVASHHNEENLGISQTCHEAEKELSAGMQCLFQEDRADVARRNDSEALSQLAVVATEDIESKNILLVVSSRTRTSTEEEDCSAFKILSSVDGIENESDLLNVPAGNMTVVKRPNDKGPLSQPSDVLTQHNEEHGFLGADLSQSRSRTEEQEYYAPPEDSAENSPDMQSVSAEGNTEVELPNDSVQLSQLSVVKNEDKDAYDLLHVVSTKDLHSARDNDSSVLNGLPLESITEGFSDLRRFSSDDCADDERPNPYEGTQVSGIGTQHNKNSDCVDEDSKQTQSSSEKRDTSDEFPTEDCTEGSSDMQRLSEEESVEVEGPNNSFPLQQPSVVRTQQTKSMQLLLVDPRLDRSSTEEEDSSFLNVLPSEDSAQDFSDMQRFFSEDSAEAERPNDPLPFTLVSVLATQQNDNSYREVDHTKNRFGTGRADSSDFKETSTQDCTEATSDMQRLSTEDCATFEVPNTSVSLPQLSVVQTPHNEESHLLRVDPVQVRRSIDEGDLSDFKDHNDEDSSVLQRCSTDDSPQAVRVDNLHPASQLAVVRSPQKLVSDSDTDMLGESRSIHQLSGNGALADKFTIGGINKEKQIDEHDNLVENAIKLLHAFTPHSPGHMDVVLALTLFYQKHGIMRTSEFFTEHKSGNNAFWTSFACPLHGVEYKSGLPLPLFFSAVSQDDRLCHLASKIFGNYTIQKGQVVFSSKKGARRAVAFAVLEAHKATGSGMALIVSSSDCVDSTIDSVATANKSHRQKHQTFPGWVRELHSIGVGAESLEITFRQHFTVGKPLSPCELCCILEVGKPRRVVSISLPRPSKRAAIEDAVLILSEELKRTEPTYSTPPSMSEMGRILKCDPANAVYLRPLPRWANGPLNGRLYLYRLRFLTTVGTDFVASRCGLGLDVLTPLGIAFASPLPESMRGDRSFRAQFELLRPNKKSNERVAIEISDPVIVDSLNDNHPVRSQHCSPERLEDMVTFNEMICSWRDYGQQVPAQIVQKRTRSATAVDRTYMFVPLRKDNESSPTVDWHLLTEIAKNRYSPFLKGVDQDWTIPILGKVDLLFLCILLASLSLAILIPDIVRSLRTHRESGWLLDLRFILIGMNALAVFLGLLSAAAFFAFVFYPPRKVVEKRTLQNRFMLELKPGQRRLLVSPSKDHHENAFERIESQLSGYSRVMNPSGSGLTESVLEANRRKFRLDMRTASFATLYRKKFGITIRYPRQRLLHGVPVCKHPEQDFLFHSKKERFRYLMPELVIVLPLPRDALYILKHACTFMPALEEAILSMDLASQMRTPLYSSCVPAIENSSVTRPSGDNLNLVELLDEALTVSKYQRLEFLGDAVLGFFLGINLMARNSSLMWDIDDLAIIFSVACKNSTLYDSALRIGVGSLLRTGNVVWSSAFQAQPGISVGATKTPLEVVQTITRSCSYDYHIINANDKVLSDVVESMLGAAFLFGQSGDTQVLNNLFEGLRLPVSCQELLDSDDTLPWFTSTSRCLNQGYHFGNDQVWHEQVLATGVSFDSDTVVSAKLENGIHGLVHLLAALSGDSALGGKLSTPHAMLLLKCALFDDSLNEVEDVPTNETQADETEVSGIGGTNGLRTFGHAGLERGLFRAALLRDTLAFVGSHALKLCITNELFHRFPDANQCSLHILRVCAMADDVAVYIMFKAGIHKFLLDQDAVCIPKFISVMEMSDVLGRADWLKCNGWIVSGGASEYAARSHNPPRHRDSAKPQYFGIAGGRLVGRKQKLPESITSDLMFSLKAIIGALVLSVGIDGMWTSIGPLFDEVMLLRIDELRAAYPDSSIIT